MAKGSSAVVPMLILAAFLGWAHLASGADWSAAATSERDDVETVAIPVAKFIMGSDDPEADDNERPVSKIFVGAFSIDKFEVTNARYLRCVEAGACTRPVGQGYDDATKANLPVTIISWQQAVAYCRWAGKRLPTEAEWEKAARGTDGRRYPWGDSFLAERANVGYTTGTTAVGRYPKGASLYGAMDMAGNVWEWTFVTLSTCRIPIIRTMVGKTQTPEEVGSSAVVAGTTPQGTPGRPTGLPSVISIGASPILGSAAPSSTVHWWSQMIGGDGRGFGSTTGWFVTVSHDHAGRRCGAEFRRG